MTTFRRPPLPGSRPQRTQKSELTEKIERANWARLADRSAPLPDDIPLDNLFEFFKGLRITQWIDSGRMALDD